MYKGEKHKKRKYKKLVIKTGEFNGATKNREKYHKTDSMIESIADPASVLISKVTSKGMEIEPIAFMRQSENLNVFIYVR